MTAITDLAARGLCRRDAAKEMGVSYAGFCAMVQRHELGHLFDGRKRQPTYARFTVAGTDICINLYRRRSSAAEFERSAREIYSLSVAGFSRESAARALGLPYVTFCKRCQRLGLSHLFKAAEYRERSRAGVAREKARARASWMSAHVVGS